MPTVPVPLLESDPDVLIDLQQILLDIFEGAGYDLGIDYSKNPPPPIISEEDLEWMKEVVV